MQATMNVQLVGTASYNMDSGELNQIFVIVPDPENKNVRGYSVAKMQCARCVFDALPVDASAYPLDVTLTVKNKVSGGKVSQFALTAAIARPAPASKAG